MEERNEENSFITKHATDDLWKQMWIRKKPDEDGYFLLQLGKQIDHSMFLTAQDAFSLTIECKKLLLVSC